MNYKAMIIGETPGTLFSIEGNGDNSVIIKEGHNNVDVVSDTSKSVKIETKTIEQRNRKALLFTLIMTALKTMLVVCDGQ